LKFAVTGANGYVGSRIVSFLRETAHNKVYELRRRVSKNTNPYDIPFSLDMNFPPDYLAGFDALIHCAYDFQQISPKCIRELNVNSSIKLFEAAKSSGVKRLIFISTMSAYDSCQSLYGKAKLEIERGIQQYGVSIVRPGLVYGPSPGGMVGALRSLVARLPIVPIFNGGKQILYLTHEEDLCLLVRYLCSIEEQVGPMTAASDEPMTFKAILTQFAKQHGKTVTFISIPSGVALTCLRAFEAIGIRTRLKSDSLVSLLHQDSKPDFSLIKKMGFQFRNFNK
jgi:nucleoside-diphosphate-sugar epimerase